MAWIPMINEGKASSELKDWYEKLREPWRKYDHPLDLLQNSLDLAAGNDISTQEQFQNIPTISSSSSVKDQYDSIQTIRKGSTNGNNSKNINAPTGLKKGK